MWKKLVINTLIFLFSQTCFALTAGRRSCCLILEKTEAKAALQNNFHLILANFDKVSREMKVSDILRKSALINTSQRAIFLKEIS